VLGVRGRGGDEDVGEGAGLMCRVRGGGGGVIFRRILATIFVVDKH
jgi:hypothetical protein